MIMRRNPQTDPQPQPLKSYREKRAQSRTNHNHITSTDTKGLQEIENTLQKRRLSMQEGDSLFGSFVEEDTSQELETVRIKTEALGEEDQKLQETQITRIIMKYGEALEFIKEVEEEQVYSTKINPEFNPKSVKVTPVPPIKNFPVQESKKAVIAARSSFNLSKVIPKPPTDLNNFVTPRKTTIKQVASKIPVTNSTKSDRKMPEPKMEKKVIENKGKLEQNRFLKKLENLEEEMAKLGFEKEAEAKWHLRNILELLRE